MSPEVAVVLSVAFACVTASWAVWLRFRAGDQSEVMKAWEARLTRVESEVRGQPRGIAPIQMPNRMQAR